MAGADEGENVRADDVVNGSVQMLPPMLDLLQAPLLRDQLVRLQGAPGIVLDAGEVERVSTPCAQVLLAAGRAAQAAQRAFKITNPSEVFKAAIADLGLQAEFTNWVE